MQLDQSLRAAHEARPEKEKDEKKQS
jgi:hypothetical protein